MHRKVRYWNGAYSQVPLFGWADLRGLMGPNKSQAFSLGLQDQLATNFALRLLVHHASPPYYVAQTLCRRSRTDVGHQHSPDRCPTLMITCFFSMFSVRTLRGHFKKCSEHSQHSENKSGRDDKRSSRIQLKLREVVFSCAGWWFIC